MSFKDYFSVQAADYARFRPDYPKELFDFILAHTPNRHIAWDCATGNGQVAIVLAEYFDQVIATDASKSQLAAAIKNEKIIYHVATAENSGLDEHSIDLITVAQALHWFNFDQFYKEVERVAAPGALLAVSCYGNHWIEPTIDTIIRHYYDTIVGPYWPKERSYIDHEYRDIPFPYKEITAPEIIMYKDWDLSTVVGYLYTWSATQQYIKVNGTNPLEQIENDLLKAWGEKNEVRRIFWKIVVKAAKIG